MTTLRHNYLPDLQEQFSYNDQITFWINKDTGDLHIRTDKGEEVIPTLSVSGYWIFWLSSKRFIGRGKD